MQQTEWSPPALGVAACGVLGLMMATAAVTLVTDAPGRDSRNHCRCRTSVVCNTFVACPTKAGNQRRRSINSRTAAHTPAREGGHQDHPHHRIPADRPKSAAARDRHNRRSAIRPDPMGFGHRPAGRARCADRGRATPAARSPSGDGDRVDHHGLGRPVADGRRQWSRWRRRPSATPGRRPHRRWCASG